MKCCLCGKQITDDQGHDAYPLRPESWYGDKENRCCEKCNVSFVTPARIKFGRNNVSEESVAKFQTMRYYELTKYFNK